MCFQACLRGHNARKRVRAMRLDRALSNPPPPPAAAASILPFAGQRAQQQTTAPAESHSYLRSMLPFSRLGPKIAKKGKGYFAF